MNRESRLIGILDLLGASGKLDVAEIVETFGVSPATARRDLDVLAERQLVSRTHGGANAESIAYDLPLRYKREHNADFKQRIGQAVQSMVPAGASVGLSGGTTTTAIAAELGIRKDLADGPGVTIVTNALNIATQLAIRSNIRVVTTGGVLHARSYELVGPFAERTLEQVVLDVAFLGLNGIDGDRGPMVHDEQEAQVNAAMARRAHDAWLVADASKIGVRAFARMGEAAWYRGIVTDDRITDAQREAMQKLGLEVVIA